MEGGEMGSEDLKLARSSIEWSRFMQGTTVLSRPVIDKILRGRLMRGHSG